MKVNRKFIIVSCLLGFFIIICCFIFPVFKSAPARIQTTQATIAEFMVHARDFHEQTGHWPIEKNGSCTKITRENIVKAIAPKFFDVLPSTFLLTGDSWATPFLVIVSDDCFIVISAGEDKKYYTSDDIVGRFQPNKSANARDMGDLVINGPSKTTMIVGKKEQQAIRNIKRTKTGGSARALSVNS